MPTPGEHKTVQDRILHYAKEIGWTYVPPAEAEARRGFDPDGSTPEERAWTASLYFGDLLHQLMTAQLYVHNLDLESGDVSRRAKRSQACALQER